MPGCITNTRTMGRRGAERHSQSDADRKRDWKCQNASFRQNQLVLRCQAQSIQILAVGNQDFSGACEDVLTVDSIFTHCDISVSRAHAFGIEFSSHLTKSHQRSKHLQTRNLVQSRPASPNMF